jgi:hypothetical protein
MFLTETSTRHSLLTKRKHFRDKVPGKLKSNSSRLIDETNTSPVDVEGHSVPILLREESDDDNINLDAIPAVDERTGPRRNKRQRGEVVADSDSDFEPLDGDRDVAAIEINSDDDDEEVSSRPPKRTRRLAALDDDKDETEDPDDKKKMAMEISYEGFAIYGLCLCLIVKRRESTARTGGSRPSAGTTTSTTLSGNEIGPGGHATMENWITSTQIPIEAEAAEGAGT